MIGLRPGNLSPKAARLYLLLLRSRPSPVTVGRSACNCWYCCPFAFCWAVVCRIRPRFCRNPRAMASSSERSITAPVACPVTSDPLNESCVGAARFWPPGVDSCWTPPSTTWACAGVVAPGAFDPPAGACARPSIPSQNAAQAECHQDAACGLRCFPWSHCFYGTCTFWTGGRKSPHT